jgi:hypothetical protein
MTLEYIKLLLYAIGAGCMCVCKHNCWIAGGCWLSGSQLRVVCNGCLKHDSPWPHLRHQEVLEVLTEEQQAAAVTSCNRTCKEALTCSRGVSDKIRSDDGVNAGHRKTARAAYTDCRPQRACRASRKLSYAVSRPLTSSVFPQSQVSCCALAACCRHGCFGKIQLCLSVRMARASLRSYCLKGRLWRYSCGASGG